MTAPTCGTCGTGVSSGDAYCERCGATLRPEQPAPPPARQPAQQPVVVYTQPALQAPPAVDPLVGEAAPNQTYLGNRLGYSDTFTAFDPLTNQSFLRALAARFFAVVGAWWAGVIVLFLAFGIVGINDALSATTDPYGDSSGGGNTMLTVWFVLTLGWSLLLASLFWLARLPTQLSEWMLTVDGKAAAARRALEHMYAIIAARRTPVRGMGVIQLSPPGQAARDYVQIVDGVYVGFVSCFGFGSDLFIGWTFWLNLSPARWLVMTFGRMFRGHGAGLYGSLAFDQPKALREVMHSAVRQGVDVATGEAEAAGQGSLGVTVPVVAVNI